MRQVKSRVLAAAECTVIALWKELFLGVVFSLGERRDVLRQKTLADVNEAIVAHSSRGRCKPKMIQTIDELIEHVLSAAEDWGRFGHVTVRKYSDLLVFSYNTMAQYNEEWNFFERVCRGLIINYKTGEIVARPFDKFFNWGEGGRFTTAPIVAITEKLDGSLGILYRHEGKYKISTRGTLDSAQAQWATDFLNQHYSLAGLADELTLMFEIIYPENRIVLDYGKRQDLVLLAGRNRFTGDYLSFAQVRELAERYGFSLPKVYEFDAIEAILQDLAEQGSDFEGYVAEFADGQRFKFKGRRYLELHKLITYLSFKNVRKAMENNQLESLLGAIPDEFLGEAKVWIAEIEAILASETERLMAIFAAAPKETRKDFALWVMANHKQDSKYLFSLMDGGVLKPLIFQHYHWREEES
jgi:RNA ligase